MTIDRSISLAIARKELSDCIPYAGRYNWEISPINEKEMSFNVRMRSPLDNELYIVKIAFDDYRQKPLLIEFLDPDTGKIGSPRSYPRSTRDSFFHSMPCIFHPCSRKAYYVFSGINRYLTPHYWEKDPEIGPLKTIKGVLLAISSRISDAEHYGGRMSDP